METDLEKVTVSRITGDARSVVDDVVARESPLTIILNNRELVTLLCTPSDANYLAIGFLSSEGLLAAPTEIKKLLFDEARGIVRVETVEDRAETDEVFRRFITSGCGRGASFYSAADAGELAKVSSELKVTFGQIWSLLKEFQERSELYRSTGGVHSAALCDKKSVLVFAEDVGRHNAIDKVFGRCFLEGMPTDDRIVLTSGRISSEILLKVARRNVPVIVSKSAPTTLGVKLAGDLGVTILGFARGHRMNAYANDWRITLDEHS